MASCCVVFVIIREKGEVLSKHMGKEAASVLFKLFINGYE